MKPVHMAPQGQQAAPLVPTDLTWAVEEQQPAPLFAR